MADVRVTKDLSGVNKAIKREAKKAQKIVNKHVDKKAERIRAFRREASRLVSMANKRLIRLEANKLTDAPAYQKLVEIMGPKPRFGIRGKSYNEVQREVAIMRQFLNAKTSTVRGANRVLKEMARNTGIKYKNLKELRSKAKQFFELASKIEQYLRTVDDMASAIGYQRIWEQINTYVKEQRIDLSKAENDIDRMVYEITKALREYDKPISINEGNFSAWFKLPKT